MAGAGVGPRGSAPIITMSRLETVVTGSSDETRNYLLELQMNVRENFIITEKATTRALSRHVIWMPSQRPTGSFKS